MKFQVTNNKTGVSFVADDLRRALEAVLAGHLHDQYVVAGIDYLVAANDRGEQLAHSAWATALGVTVTITN